MINSILLIDDNADDNFVHERIIRKSGLCQNVTSIYTAEEALAFLKEKQYEPDQAPDIIFLDINMPGMNGWEFLQEYQKLSEDLKSKVVVTMLSTSDNPDDIKKAENLIPEVIKAFKTKPLSIKALQEIVETHLT